MPFRAAGFLFLTATLCACSEDAAPTAPTPSAPAAAATIRVSGRVVDYASGRSIPGYTVRWWNGSNSHLMLRIGQFDTVTDAAGRYEVDVPVTDDFTLLTDKLLYEVSQGSGVIRIPAKSMETDLLVNGGPCAARYGYVFDAVTRQPIAGARVVRAGSAITDANGYYRIDIGCEPFGYERWGIGTTTIHATHPAYQGTSELDGRAENTSYSGVRRIDFALQPQGQ